MKSTFHEMGPPYYCRQHKIAWIYLFLEAYHSHMKEVQTSCGEKRAATKTSYVFIEVHRGPSNIAFTCISTLQYTLLYVGQGKN